MSEQAIVVTGVSKHFVIPRVQRSTVREHVFDLFRRRPVDRLEVLNEISFSVSRGQSIGLMGRNGSGKSTLLKMLAGIYQPDRGEITISGDVTPILELGVGFHPELDAVDNVYLLGTVMGLSLPEVSRSLDDILKFAQLERFARLKLQHFSSGMVARLAYSVAFSAVRDVLLLDEIFAVGDAGFRARCEERYRQLVSEGRTVVLVSHDPSAVGDLCHKAILIDGGSMVASGRAPEVAEQYVRLLAGDSAVPPQRKQYLRVSVGSGTLRHAALAPPPTALLACPHCSGAIDIRPGVASCPQCSYMRVQHDGSCLDLRPLDWNPEPAWEIRQDRMERWFEDLAGNPGKAHGLLEYDYSELIATLNAVEGAVVDIGAGLGLARQYLTRATSYVAVEPSLFWFDQHWTALHDVFPVLRDLMPFVRGVGEHLPLRTAAFDCALMLWTLNHTADPAQVLDHAYRVLRPGGRLLLVLDDMEPTAADLEAKPELQWRPRVEGESDHRPLTEHALTTMFGNRFTVARRGWACHYLILELTRDDVRFTAPNHERARAADNTSAVASV